MSRYQTTQINVAATLHAMGYHIIGGHEINADEAEELQERGEPNARAGSVVFEVDADPEDERFLAILPAVEAGQVFPLEVDRRKGHRICQRLIRTYIPRGDSA